MLGTTDIPQKFKKELVDVSSSQSFGVAGSNMMDFEKSISAFDLNANGLRI